MFFLTSGWAAAQDVRVCRAPHSMVATVHPLATEAALLAFEQGGNAVDAAVSAALTLGVVDGFNSGIGGGCFVLIRSADGRITAIDAREMAPAAATRDMYLRDGKPVPELSQTGALAVGVPGALAGYCEAVDEFGRLRFSDLIQAAAARAEQGFEIDPEYAGRMNSRLEDLARDPGCKAVFFRPDGQPLQVGDRLVQPDLARSCRMIAEEGTAWFYRGEFAQRTGEWMAAHGGILTADDLASYHTVRREPLVTTYRQYRVIGFPPPSSGGVHVAQILNMLEQFDLPAMNRADPLAFAHVTAEAMKRAFADRAHWLGDPDFTPVPRGLVDKEYARQLAAAIDPIRATSVEGPGNPQAADSDLFSRPRHTTHIAAADAEGNWVAITTTVNTTFGACVIVPGTGIVLNNQMDDFSIAPGTPNAFGLVGNEANAVQAGKRPLSSMSPTIVCDGDQPILTIGGAGGPRIITSVLLGIVRQLDFGMELDEALGAPRLHHQWAPDRLYLENPFGEQVAAQLRERGHNVRLAGPGDGFAAVQAIRLDRSTDPPTLVGMPDPRMRGTAAGR